MAERGVAGAAAAGPAADRGAGADAVGILVILRSAGVVCKRSATEVSRRLLRNAAAPAHY